MIPETLNICAQEEVFEASMLSRAKVDGVHLQQAMAYIPIQGAARNAKILTHLVRIHINERDFS